MIDVFKQIKGLTYMPYKNRKSIDYGDNFIKDLIFKGYVITCRISETKQEIEVFGFIKYLVKP